MARPLIKPDARPGLLLTARDIQIIRAVYRYRFLTTDQIQLLTGTGSRTKTVRIAGITAPAARERLLS